MSSPVSPRTFRYHSNHEPLFSSPQQLVDFADSMSQRRGVTSMPTFTQTRGRPLEPRQAYVQIQQDQYTEQIARQARRINTLEADLRVFTNGTRRRPGPMNEIALRRRDHRQKTSIRAVPLLDFEADINGNPPPERWYADHRISV